MNNKKINFDEYVDDRKYTKGMCYALCEFLETLTRYNKDVIKDIASALDTDSEYYQELLERLASDINNVICDEQDESDYTEQMAQIMEIKHVSAENDKQGFTIETQTAEGKFYGYVAEHPEEPGLPYYSEEPDDAIIFETMQDAQNWIDTNSEGTDFNFIIINKKD